MNIGDMPHLCGFAGTGRARKQVRSLCFLAFWLAAVSLVMTGCSTVSQPSAGRSSAGVSSGTAASGLPKAGSGRGGYYKDDGPMDYTPEDLQNTPDAIPRVEPYARAANRPYTVFGKTYVPVTDNRPYKVRGMGSWYGKKFHGNKTSSGEIYDMFKMTAAHPTLPIPCYARVTNLGTGKQVIVRVNDRGPFHSDRIIDLSYTAALKLDYLQKGSALLEVEHLLPDEIERINLARSQNPVPAASVSSQTAAAQTTVSPAPRPAPAPVAAAAGTADKGNSSTIVAYYLQLGAYQQIGNARATQAEYALNWAHLLPGVEVVAADDYYRLFAGPFTSQEAADYAAQQLGATGSRPLVVKR
ncbi:MAG: septal ring lytic transglycosylase RlpA family protein [Alistipes senegalensis]|nr:septal ring lytic transglycosylase RlpA family protein [Oxalobacter formigenes]MCM1281374.1 septal ring lytic transglycosylase RlpA family protein [Alistipes senegalensis]